MINNKRVTSSYTLKIKVLWCRSLFKWGKDHWLGKNNSCRDFVSLLWYWAGQTEHWRDSRHEGHLNNRNTTWTFHWFYQINSYFLFLNQEVCRVTAAKWKHNRKNKSWVNTDNNNVVVVTQEMQRGQSGVTAVTFEHRKSPRQTGRYWSKQAGWFRSSLKFSLS